MDEVLAFYDSLAADYASIFIDWDAAVVRQGEIIDGVIRSLTSGTAHTVLDATCGIGTQAIGLALRGYDVTATDLSPASVERARGEATRFGVDIDLDVADVRSLPDTVRRGFDVVISFDNALPHLVGPIDLRSALASLRGVLRAGGVLVASIRDYDALLAARPSGEAPRMSGVAGARRVVTQAWEWDPVEPVYRLHQFVLREAGDGSWSARHLEVPYRALTRRELGERATEAGFEEVRWLEPAVSRFYQPILVARRG